MNTKDKVMLIIQRSVSEAQDNLFKARRQFHGMNSKELKQPYGHSGKSCQSILIEYKNKLADYERCLEWVRNRTE